MKRLGKLLRIAAAAALVCAAAYGYVTLEGSKGAAVLVLVCIFGAAAVMLTGDFGEKTAGKYRPKPEEEEEAQGEEKTQGEENMREKEKDEGPERIPAMRILMIVPPDAKPADIEKADFNSIAEAVASVSKDNQEPVKMILQAGIYEEKVVIDRPNLILEGEGEREAVIRWGDYAGKSCGGGETLGTFQSYTMLVDAHDVTLRNLVIENTAGPKGQAIALYADGDRLLFEDCSILGYQDTLFTGPLPPKEGIPGGFRGPKEHAERRMGRQCYRNCRIAGSVDFIFGSAAAYFEKCVIESVLPGYIAAASTPEGQEYGYVFESCSLKGRRPECPEGSVYLGRPWRDGAKTVYCNCRMGKHIHPEGWDDWGREEARKTVRYAEYGSRGEGASSSRADYAARLTEEEAERFTKEAVLGGTDGWNP